MGSSNRQGKSDDEFNAEDVYAKAARMRETLQALMAELEDFMNDRPVTAGEQRAASRVPPEYLGAAADLAEAAPELLTGVPPRCDRSLRRAEVVERALTPVAGDAERFMQTVRMAVARTKRPAVRHARTIDQVGRALVDTGAAECLRPHVDRLKSILSRPPHTPAPPKPKKK